MRPLIFLAFLIASPAIAAPSFECVKARSKAEKAICSNPEAAALDLAVADAYRLALSRLEPDSEAVARLKRDQKVFVTYRDKFIDNENLVLVDYLAKRRDFLLSIDPTVRSGVEGHWRSFWGETRITASAGGAPEIRHWMVEPVLQSWHCGDPAEVASGRPVRGGVETGRKDDGLRFERKDRLLKISVISQPDVETSNSCGFLGKDTDVMFPAMPAQPVAAEAKPQPRKSGVKLANLLSRLPAEAFDHTTDGIEAAELKELVAKGASAQWVLKMVSDQKGIASARKPFAEVHLTLARIDGVDLVQALTFNEKAINYSYWAIGDAGKALTSHALKPMTRLLHETVDGRAPVALADILQPIRRFIEKTEQCLHWEGEISDDIAPARKREINDNLGKLGCAGRRNEEKRLSAQFASQPIWHFILSRTELLLSGKAVN